MPSAFRYGRADARRGWSARRLIAPLLASSLMVAAPNAMASREPANVVGPVVAPKLDGVLDDVVWQQARTIRDFLQVSPQSGGAPSVATEVRFVHDGETLFVSITATDPVGVTRVARQTRREAELFGDDHLSLVLDPSAAGRNGYGFRINPNGAQQDALIFDGGAERGDWDAIWDARVVATESGWTAELAIPLVAMSGSSAGAWGFNLERYIAATGERIRWRGTLPDREVNVMSVCRDHADVAGD